MALKPASGEQRKLRPSEFESTCTECNRYFRLVAQYTEHLVLRDHRVVCLTEDEQYPLTQCGRCGTILRRHTLRAHWAEQATMTNERVPGKHHTKTYRRKVQLWYAEPCQPIEPEVQQRWCSVEPEPPLPYELVLDLKDQLCDLVDPADDW